MFIFLKGEKTVFEFEKKKMIVLEKLKEIKILITGTSLVVQWLRIHILNTRDPGSVPDQGTRSCMLQLRPSTVKKINKNKYIF